MTRGQGGSLILHCIGLSPTAHQSLHEAALNLIRVYLLEAPSTLHTSLLSTNMIENTIRNFRYGNGRVNRWPVQTDQAVRWLATGLLMAEEGFHGLSHYVDLPVLVAHLATRRDKENLEALQKKLPDWLQGGVTEAVHESDKQGLEPATSCVSCTPMLTAQVALR